MMASLQIFHYWCSTYLDQTSVTWQTWRLQSMLNKIVILQYRWQGWFAGQWGQDESINQAVPLWQPIQRQDFIGDNAVFRSINRYLGGLWTSSYQYILHLQQMHTWDSCQMNAWRLFWICIEHDLSGIKQEWLWHVKISNLMSMSGCRLHGMLDMLKLPWLSWIQAPDACKRPPYRRWGTTAR